jgi:hypothetical protein
MYMAEQCAINEGSLKFMSKLNKDFNKVLNAQKSGESFWDAYNRVID